MERLGLSYRSSGRSTRGRTAFRLRLRLCDEFGESRVRIVLPAETPAIGPDEENLCGRPHEAPRREVAAEHTASGVGQGHVQMGSVQRDSALERKHLERPAQHASVLFPREADPGIAQAADARQNEVTPGIAGLAVRFESQAKIGARWQP